MSEQNNLTFDFMAARNVTQIGHIQNAYPKLNAGRSCMLVATVADRSSVAAQNGYHSARYHDDELYLNSPDLPILYPDC